MKAGLVGGKVYVAMVPSPQPCVVRPGPNSNSSNATSVLDSDSEGEPYSGNDMQIVGTAVWFGPGEEFLGKYVVLSSVNVTTRSTFRIDNLGSDEQYNAGFGHFLDELAGEDEDAFAWLIEEVCCAGVFASGNNQV